jgi:hypothetical protein
MPDAESKPIAGWYTHPDLHNTVAYWDGDKWTDKSAPSPQPAGPGVLTIARGVAVGVAAVIAASALIYNVAHSNDDLECATENVNRVESGLPALNC